MRVIGITFLFVAAIYGCNTKQDVPAQHNTQTTIHSDDEQSPIPKLWVDDDAARMIKQLAGYSNLDQVYVVRWEHGGLVGRADFDAEDGAKVSHDLSVPTGGSDIDGDDILSGWLVVAMRRLAEADGEAYEVLIEEEYTYRLGPNDTNTPRFDSRRGTLLRVPPADVGKQVILSSHGGTRFELLKSRDGTAVPWLEIKLGSTPLEDEIGADRADGPEPN